MRSPIFQLTTLYIVCRTFSVMLIKVVNFVMSIFQILLVVHINSCFCEKQFFSNILYIFLAAANETRETWTRHGTTWIYLSFDFAISLLIRLGKLGWNLSIIRCTINTETRNYCAQFSTQCAIFNYLICFIGFLNSTNIIIPAEQPKDTTVENISRVTRNEKIK